MLQFGMCGRRRASRVAAQGHLAKEMTMMLKPTKQLVVLSSDSRTRDPRRVQVGGVIKKLPVSPPDKATRDQGKVRVGGVITKLPKR
jgi:hypothetical protein